jgi:hypothetical protein
VKFCPTLSGVFRQECTENSFHHTKTKRKDYLSGDGFTKTTRFYSPGDFLWVAVEDWVKQVFQVVKIAPPEHIIQYYVEKLIKQEITYQQGLKDSGSVVDK